MKSCLVLGALSSVYLTFLGSLAKAIHGQVPSARSLSPRAQLWSVFSDSLLKEKFKKKFMFVSSHFLFVKFLVLSLIW